MNQIDTKELISKDLLKNLDEQVKTPIDEFNEKKKLLNNSRKTNRRKSTLMKQIKQKDLDLKMFSSMVLNEANLRFNQLTKDVDLSKDIYTKDEIVKLLTIIRGDKMFEASMVMYLHYFHRYSIDQYKEWSKKFENVLIETERESIQAEIEAESKNKTDIEKEPEVEIIEPDKKSKKIKEATEVIDASN